MKKGKLIVNVQSDSYFLEGRIPIEIRDSRLALVKKLQSGDTLEVDPGLYQISSVLQDGQDYNQVVNVPESGRIEITIKPSDKVIQKPKYTSKTGPAKTIILSPPPNKQAFPHGQFVTGIDHFSQPRMKTKTIINKHPKLILEGIKGAKVQSSDDGHWVFEPDGDINAVPRAQFKIGREFVDVSLPIYPNFHSELNICEVYVQPSPVGYKVRAWISPKRTVASTLQRLLTSGYLLKAADIATEADNLLYSKYQDPTGAALGALLLHKTNRLIERQDWVRNLANSFEWLPDGKILLAILLSQDKNKLDQALDLAVKACYAPALFTESHSLLLNFLRKWKTKPWLNLPKNENLKKKLSSALTALAKISPYIDWEATTLTNNLPKGGLSCWK